MQGRMSWSSDFCKNRLYNNKRGFAAVRSGIKAWHEFAVEVLVCSKRCTLPPKASMHVQNVRVYLYLSRDSQQLCGKREVCLLDEELGHIDMGWQTAETGGEGFDKEALKVLVV